MKTKTVMICGVGGQGILLASDLLATAMMDMKMDVKKSEVHGMSQRGGTVVSNVKFGEKVFSPLIGKGNVDIILAFEKLEGLRHIEFLKENASIIVNDFAIDPLPVASGLATYPENILSVIRMNVKDTTVIKGFEIAEKAGNPKTMNVALLGALGKKLNTEKKIWYHVIEQRLPEKTWKINKRAFELGYES